MFPFNSMRNIAGRGKSHASRTCFWTPARAGWLKRESEWTSDWVNTGAYFEKRAGELIQQSMGIFIVTLIHFSSKKCTLWSINLCTQDCLRSDHRMSSGMRFYCARSLCILRMAWLRCKKGMTVSVELWCIFNVRQTTFLYPEGVRSILCQRLWQEP